MAHFTDKEVDRFKELLTQERLEAGSEYYTALKGLGLDPDILAWVYEPEIDLIHLALVSSLVDRVGPKAIYSVLFAAYDVAATPRSIDPFTVSVYSPNMVLAVDLRNSLKIPENGILHLGPGYSSHINETLFIVGLAEPKLIHGRGIYCARSWIRTADQDRRAWDVLQSRVNALAA